MKRSAYVFKRLLRYVLRYQFRLLGLMLLGLVGVSFEVLKPLPLKVIIDYVLSGQPVPASWNELFGGAGFLADRQQLLLVTISVLVLLVVLSAVVSLILSNYTVQLAQKLVYDISVDFFSKLQRLSLSFYSRNQVGDLVQRIGGDVYVVYFLVAQILLPVVTSLVCLVAMFYVMASINLTLALIALSVVPLLAITLGFFARPMNDTTQLQQQLQGRLSAFVQQSLSSMKIIQAFGRERYMHAKMEERALAFSEAFRTATKVSMSYQQLSYLITGLATAAVVGLGALRNIEGTISTGDLFVFIGYISALYGPVNSLTTAIGAAITITARGKRIFDILDSDEEVPEKSHALPMPQIRGAVEFRNVSFGYGHPDHDPFIALRNISFSIQPGQVVAVVGPTGAGKTSLISLLTRFYDPWVGKVMLDGEDIRDLKLHDLREQISLVMQEPFLFPMSIAENIAFGNPQASFDEVVDAAKAAQAHDFIVRLPKGYETVISEAGASLSGGERQRIAIARAFLKKASILILDEPTSAVDALTESKIFSALAKMSKGRTVFVISHRLSTIRHADQILTIKNGTLVESGTHEELIEAGMVYADLYKYHHIV